MASRSARIVALFMLTGLLGMGAHADPTPVQFSFFDFNAPDNQVVHGARFPALYGKSGHVSGVDLQIAAYSELDSLTGVSIPIVFGIGGNRIRNEMKGVSLGLVSWHQGQDTGANLSVVNVTNNVKGLNLGTVNYSTGQTSADVSAVNVSKKSAFQLGVVNVTDEISFVQIGILNCARNGFLRCFPIVNFAKPGS